MNDRIQALHRWPQVDMLIQAERQHSFRKAAISRIANALMGKKHPYTQTERLDIGTSRQVQPPYMINKA